jgi:hypothetical protein
MTLGTLRAARPVLRKRSVRRPTRSDNASEYLVPSHPGSIRHDVEQGREHHRHIALLRCPHEHIHALPKIGHGVRNGCRAKYLLATRLHERFVIGGEHLVQLLTRPKADEVD